MRLPALFALSCSIAIAVRAEVPPNLVVDGVPSVPAELRTDVGRYLEFRSAVFRGWYPQRHEMLVSTRFADTAQVHVVKMPGGDRRQITFGVEPVSNLAIQPKVGASFVYEQDSGGGEFYQLFRFDFAEGRATLLTDGKSRNTGPKWSRDGALLAYSSTRRNGRDNDIRVMDPSSPTSDHQVFEGTGGGWSVASWSHDRRKLLLNEFISANENHLHVLDLDSGKAEMITPQGGPKTVWGEATFAPDDRSILVLTDQGGEFTRLVRMDLQTKAVEGLSKDIPWNIDDFKLSQNGQRIAIISNEDGSSVLRILDAETGALVSKPKLPLGVISNLAWYRNGRELGFTLNSAHSPSDAYSLDLATDLITRWTESETGGLDTSKFPEAELLRIESFDGLKMSGFLYRPDGKKFPGPRPCVVMIHGGPEGQSRPIFQARNNYLLNELGIALFYPNVRGSEGYGKTFLTLDDGFKREDSVRDIGAFLDKLSADPALDKERIAVIGGSYGGYMTLASLTHFSDRLRCGVDIVGISNFLSFLKNTQDYRRDLRRVEYGDERDPAMAEFLGKISPLNNVQKITRPLMVVQGKNDPRVPVSEAEQIVKAVRGQGGTCWYLMATDEGHGFAKKANADYQFLTEILFLKDNLLGQPASANEAKK